MSEVVRLGDRSSHLYCTACLPDCLASHDWTGSMSRHRPSQNIKHRENIASDSPEPVWGWYTPHHFLVSTFWSRPPSGLSWLELFSIPSGQYGRIQQPTPNISHEPASIICPLCGAARISKSLLSSHATASPRSRRPLASPVSLLWRMKGDNCVNWCYSEMFSYSVLSSHHSNHHEGGMVIIESRWRMGAAQTHGGHCLCYPQCGNNGIFSCLVALCLQI